MKCLGLMRLICIFYMKETQVLSFKLWFLGLKTFEPTFVSVTEYALTRFTTNPRPASATGVHWVVTGHLQVAVGQPVLEF